MCMVKRFIFNPLKLTADESNLTILMKLKTEAKLGKYLKEKCHPEYYKEFIWKILKYLSELKVS